MFMTVEGSPVRVKQAANDNYTPAPLHIVLAAVETMECIWRGLYGDSGGLTRLDARRDRRAIRRMRESAYRDWNRGRA